jgi:hypothetical protein
MIMRREEMEEFGLLKKLEKVKAPPDFEQKVMARVSLQKRSLGPKRTAFRLSLAGAFVSLLVVFVLLNVFVLQKKSPVGVSDLKKEVPAASEIVQTAAGQIIRVIETLDYSTEVRSRSLEPQTVYLLEQVSDTTSKEIRY